MGDFSVNRTALSPLQVLGFSSPSFPIGALTVATLVYLPHYYATHLGLSLALIGGAFTTVRLIDVLFDPVIGLVMDRTHTRLGRYRLWMVCGAPLFIVAAHQLFMAPKGIGGGYLIGWLLAFYIGISIILLSHLSWAAIIAPDYHDRSRLFGWIQILGVVGACAILLTPNIAAMGWMLIVAAPLGIVLALFTTPEPPILESQTQGDKTGRVKLRDYGRMIARPDMRRIITADFCLQLGPNWMAALYLFYFRDLGGFTLAQTNLLLMIYVVAGLVGAVVISRLATLFGKHRTLMGASAGFSIGLLGVALLPKADMLVAAPLMFALGVLATSFVLLDRAMIADVGDAIWLETGENRTGLLYAILTTSQKVAGALSIGLTYGVLGLVGYDAKVGAANTPAALHGLSLVFLLGPVCFVLLGGACYLGYTLNAKRHGEIRAALDAREAGAAP